MDDDLLNCVELCMREMKAFCQRRGIYAGKYPGKFILEYMEFSLVRNSMIVME